MTDIKEPINTTSDGTFLSVVCENPKKVLLAKSWGGLGGITPLDKRHVGTIVAQKCLQSTDYFIIEHHFIHYSSFFHIPP